MNRRSFLKGIGVGAAMVVVPQYPGFYVGKGQRVVRPMGWEEITSTVYGSPELSEAARDLYDGFIDQTRYGVMTGVKIYGRIDA